MSPSPAVALRGVRRMEGSRTGLGVSALAAAGAVAAGVATLLGSGSADDKGAIVGFLLLPFVFGLIGTSWFGRLGRRAVGEPAELRVTDDAVSLGDEVVLARRDVASAVVWPARNLGTIVRIAHAGPAGRTTDLLVGSLEDGRAVVRALRQGATQTTHAFRIAATSPAQYRRRLIAFWVGAPLSLAILAIVGGATHGAWPFGWVAGAVALAYLVQVAQVMASGRASVGADGISIGWWWQRSFIPMSEVVRAERIDGERSWTGYYPVIVRIHRRSGPPVDVLGHLTKTTSRGLDGEWGHLVSREADMLVERITEAVAERGPPGGADLATWESELLSRGERSVADWTKALRGLHADVESFRRQAGGGIDALWSVVEDAGAPAERRAAAAVALAPHLDGGGRDRVRIAAQATVAPRLRIALEAAADEDEDALATALEEVSRDASRAGPRVA